MAKPLQRLNEDDRYQIEMTAQSVERRNKSTTLFMLSLLVLAICALVWVWGWRAKTSAIDELRARQRQAVTIEAKLMRIEEAQSAGTEVYGEPITDPPIGTRLRLIGDRTGIGEELPVPTQNQRSLAGGVVRTYQYEGVTHTTLEPIVEWIARAIEEVPGLEIYQLQIEPNEARKQWDVTVIFRRWERAQ